MARLTFADYKAQVKHTLHSDPNALWTNADTTKGHIVNQANRYLVSMHQWTWRNRPAEVNLPFTKDQPYIDVPYTFDGIIDIRPPSTNYRYSEIQSLELLERKRSDPIPSGFDLLYALSYPSQVSKEHGPPNPRIEVHPTPTSDQANAIKLLYRGGAIDMAMDTAVPNIHEKYESLLVMLVSAFAISHDQERRDALEEIERSSFLRNLKNDDGTMQSTHGRPQGGIMETPIPDHTRSFIVQVTSG